MNGSRRIGVPQRGHGSPSRPYTAERAIEVAAGSVDVDIEGIEGGATVVQRVAHHARRSGVITPAAWARDSVLIGRA